MGTLTDVTRELFQKSENLFWLGLPAATLFAMLLIYISGEITGGRIETVLKRIVIAILLLQAFPEISKFFSSMEANLVQYFGGEESLQTIFERVKAHIDNVSDTGAGFWLKFGQYALTLISTLSFLLLAVVKKFLDVIHLTLWNLIHILGPIALLGCLFPSFQAVPKGIFLGLFELALWKPIWVLIGRILLTIGFGEAPTSPETWLDTAIMNFAVAGLMVLTPNIVHAFITGALGSVGGSIMQTMTSGLAALALTAPLRGMKAAGGAAKSGIGVAASPARNFGENTVGRAYQSTRKAYISAYRKHVPKVFQNQDQNKKSNNPKEKA